MENFWQGKNIRLRAIEPSDVPLFERWDLDSERGRCLDFLWPPVSRLTLAEWVEQQSRKRLDDGTYLWVIEGEGGIPAGSIDTHSASPQNGTFGYGIYIEEAHRGKGYAGEAIRMVLRYYFQELRYQKVTVPVHADNPASIRLHEKLGFQKEGVLRRMLYTHGEYVDVIWFGMTAEEFCKT